MKEQKQIIILGGGFGGVSTAIALAKKKNPSAKITLVDKEEYHLYYPNLYEVASSEEEFVSMDSMKKSVALPFSKILPEEVLFVQGELQKIEYKRKKIIVSGKEMPYDYLIVALGAAVDFFKISGLDKYALTVKSVNDSLKIRSQCQFVVQRSSSDLNKRLIRFVIGGGGFTGVEFAGEMLNLLDIMAWKYGYPREKLEILVIEGTKSLLPGMPEEISFEIQRRLKEMGVQIRFNSFIASVAEKQIALSNGELVNYDLLIWTGGVRSTNIPFSPEIEKDNKGRIYADIYLRAKGIDNIFVIGDCANICDEHGKLMPQTATQAIHHGKYVAEAIDAKLKDLEPAAFACKTFGYIIPVRGKWAALHLPGGRNFFGIFGWLAHIFAEIRYFSKLMPFDDAVKLALFDTKMYMRND